MSSFPLPRAPQHMYSKWFKRVLGSGTFARYTILWVGSQLECRFKSDNLADNIGPHHVFVLKKGSIYGYAVIDNNDQVYRLPKKYFTACFPGVQYSSIPADNMITFRSPRRTKSRSPSSLRLFINKSRSRQHATSESERPTRTIPPPTSRRSTLVSLSRLGRY